MIVNWLCLFVYLKYKFASTSLFLLLNIRTYNTSAWRVSGHLCKPVIHKLKIVVEGIGSDQILNVSEGKQKGDGGGGVGTQFLTQI